MSKVENFLVEIGVEELPPQQIEILAAAFSQHLQSYLITEKILFKADGVKAYGTPRRIAVLISDLATQQQDHLIEKRGPAINAAYAADGTPSKAALGFAESCGVDIKYLTELKTDKGAWLYFSQKIAGQKTIDLLQSVVQQALDDLPIKKLMHWGNCKYAFVRPVHWVLMLFGTETVKANIFGIDANNISYGHRIHAPQAIKIASPSSYEKQLVEAKVIANFSERRANIEEQINLIANTEHGKAIIISELLNMVTGLVEHPVALLASFDKDFLRIPKECLISSMQDHQKCFALLDQNGHLMSKFILISNIESTDPKTVIHGNELVMHARLADAAFYYDKDKKTTLESRVEQLKTVIYQKKLGSLYNKVLRIQKLAAFIAAKINADVALTKRAAYLCKADLLTNMVYEFPELQGTMGKYYAEHDGEPEIVAEAIEAHYKPRFATDDISKGLEANCIAIADRIDTLVGFFGIGNVPTGEKDPYALRRQSLAILRILIEQGISLNLAELFSQAYKNYDHKLDTVEDEVLINLHHFFNERMKSWCLSNDIQSQIFSAVESFTTETFYNPLDLFTRMNAVLKFQQTSESTSLTAANKRVRNLFKNTKAELMENLMDKAIDEQLLSSEAEKQLFTEINKKELEIKPLLQQNNYVDTLVSLASLQAPLDNFFEKVMVMVDDENVKINRLRLLKRLRDLFIKVADISVL